MLGRMKVPISLYAALSDIARIHGVRQIDWAKAAGLSQPRLAELEMKLRAERSRKTHDPIRHAFTIQKMKLLYMGLQKIIGEVQMAKAIGNFIEENKNDNDAIVMMVIEAYNDPDFAKTARELLFPAYLNRKTEKNNAKE